MKTVDLSSARRLLRWLVVVGALSEETDVMEALESHNFESVQSALRDEAGIRRLFQPLHAPYKSFAKSLLS